MTTRSSIGSNFLRLAVLVAFIAGIICIAHSEESPQTNRVPERYLIVVETSAALRRAADNTRSIVKDLLTSGMRGQLGNGDTIGFWTFNEGLFTGLMPLQTWSSDTATNIMTNVDKFMRGLKYEKETAPEVVIPMLKPVVATSERITILMFMSGSVPVTGTPIDYHINSAFYQSGPELKKAKKPFVIMFRAQRGKFVSGAITWSPWPVEFPEFPPLPKPVDRAALEEAARTQKTNAQSTVKSLIVIGKKPEPIQEAIPEKLPPKENTTPEPAVSTGSANPPAPSTETTASPHSPANHVTGTPQVDVPSPDTHSEETQSEQPTTPSSPQSTAAPEPLTKSAAAEELIPAVQTSTPSTPESEPTTDPANAPAATVATAVSDTPPSASGRYLLAGVAALILGVGLAVLMARRQRVSGGGSLITHSMDRDEK